MTYIASLTETVSLNRVVSIQPGRHARPAGAGGLQVDQLNDHQSDRIGLRTLISGAVRPSCSFGVLLIPIYGMRRAA
jgi:hypothetical protein